MKKSKLIIHLFIFSSGACCALAFRQDTPTYYSFRNAGGQIKWSLHLPPASQCTNDALGLACSIESDVPRDSVLSLVNAFPTNCRNIYGKGKINQ